MFFCFFALLKVPELPEVETIKQELNDIIIGKKIKDVDIILARIINLAPSEFKEKSISAVVKNIERKAKNLIITLISSQNKKNYLLIHLKMTGQLIYIPPGSKDTKNKYTHVIFNFTDTSKLLFNDLRQFGYIKLLTEKELDEYFKKQNFGYEPLEKNFTLEKLKELLKDRKGKIKTILMDQTFIAGIGNLYAAEICFYAKVNPARQISTLTDNEIKNIYSGIKKILAEALKHKGSSVENYVDIYGKQGEFVPLLKVYGRKEKKCYRCGGIIQTVKLGGRGTYFCPNCQK